MIVQFHSLAPFSRAWANSICLPTAEPLIVRDAVVPVATMLNTKDAKNEL